MSEDEKQEAFREEVRGFLAKDKATLDNLVLRVDKLEKTVVHGNGTPPLVTQFATMQTKLEVLSSEFSEMKAKMNVIDEVKTELAEIRSELRVRSSGTKNWIMFGLTILTIVGTPFVTRLVFGG